MKVDKKKHTQFFPSYYLSWPKNQQKSDANLAFVNNQNVGGVPSVLVDILIMSLFICSLLDINATQNRFETAL